MPNINMDKTGENIKKLRLDSGLSVKEIQNIFGFSQSPLIMLLGIAVPIFEIMLLLKLRSYRNA